MNTLPPAALAVIAQLVRDGLDQTDARSIVTETPARIAWIVKALDGVNLSDSRNCHLICKVADALRHGG